MKLTCPACGAIASMEAWAADADARQCLRAVAELPRPVAIRVLPYLALFRPASGRGLAWSRALRLLSDLRDEISAPTIQWQRQVARPNTSAARGDALERVAANPPRRLPLKSHGYLKAIAYEIADDLDRGAEKQRNAAERSGNYVRRPNIDSTDFAQVDFTEIRRKIREGRKQQEGSG